MPTDADTVAYEVMCHHCKWKGYNTDLVKLNVGMPDGGVARVAACPSCMEWDELEEE